MDSSEHNSNEAAAEEAILLQRRTIQAMRQQLHELANVFTGVMIAGGLLSQHLAGGVLCGYAKDICESSERGCALVRQLRQQLMTACGESPIDSGPHSEPHGDDTSQHS